jgi:DnaA-homolog protein
MVKQLPVRFEFRANQTFDDFYPGSNQEILGQLEKTVTGTGEQFIFLWGNAGHGKSHLLHACCHEASNQGFSSFYLDFSGLVSTNPGLFEGLEGFEIVCFDNIDSRAGHEDWELAFFNFFNQHRDRNHRLILSASCAPNTLAFALPDLQTRINWGLSLKIQALDDNDKIAALTYKAQRMGFDIAPQAARFLLTHYDRSLSSLWSMLDKLDWASLAAKRKLTIPFLKQILAERD